MSSTSPPPPGEPQPRRSFLRECIAGVVGLLVGVSPIIAGFAVILAPLRRSSSGGQWVRVATLDAVPADGIPRRFPVVAERSDAWNVYPPEPIGSVFLRRAEDADSPEAFSTVCPHLGCSVDFRASSGKYLCPCHNSAFNVDGTRVNPESSPSPRSLDPLDVEIRNEYEVWVDYRRFQGGKSERIVV